MNTEPQILAVGIVPKYSTQKAVAFRLEYGKGWKIGDRPVRKNLGHILFPLDFGIEDADAMLRRAFPRANASRLYDEHGQLFCSGSL